MFSETVETQDGNPKTVVADSQEALTEASKNAKEDKNAVSPDINNPKHGNVVVDKFEGRI